MFDSMAGAMRHNGHKFANKTAIYYEGREITFGEYLNRSERVAAALAGLGLKKQDRVAVMCQNRPEFLEVYGAGELAGFIIATVNFRLAAAEVDGIIRSSEPKVIFFEDQYSAIFEELKDKLDFVEHFICIGEAPAWAKKYESCLPDRAEAVPFSPAPEDILHLIYTSGTTGKPKGAMRSHRAEVKAAELLATEMGVTIDDRMQLMMPLFHVGARWLQMAAHLRGAAIVLHYRFDPAEVIKEMQQKRVTVSHMAPTMVQTVLDSPEIDRFDLSSLHMICYSAAPMPVPLLRRGINKFGNVFLQLYAMTESAGGTTLHRHQHVLDADAKHLARLGSVGQASRGADVRIVDERGNPLPCGEPGEIAVKCDALMSGYWNNSIATIEVLRDGWYLTGDMGKMDEDGFVYLVDRKKDMIISGGENVYSREVEEALASHPAVADCAVIGLPDPKWGEAVHAVVVCAKGMQVSEAELIEHCRAQIASYKKPRSVAFVEALPRLASGKIDKKQLRREWSVL
jgi:acyl-CoA synthetase (AMP-forming)/AMP-acid ligase II